jgi:hypothetical protein
LLFLFLKAATLLATHNRAGEILYKRIAPFSQVINNTTVPVYTYSITVIKYTNDGSGIADRCYDTIRFGDGTFAAVARINGLVSGCCNTIPCGEIVVNSVNYKIKKNIYSTVHTYPGPGNFVIRSYDPNRNQGIMNIPNSVNLPFYIESMLIITPGYQPNSSPVLENPPIEQGIIGACFYHNPCAYDDDGDSLSYEITTCREAGGQTITGYSYPAAGSNGTFAIHPTTGLLTWCNPQAIGLFSAAYIVKEWRKAACTGTYQLLGYVLRDMQIDVGQSSSPVIFMSNGFLGSQDTCVIAGTTVQRTFTAAASGNQSLNFSLKLHGSIMNPVYTPTPAISPSFVNATGTATLTWQTSCAHVQKFPHEIFVTASAGVSSTQQTFYRSFRVKVMSRSPKITNLTLDTGKATLHWKKLSACNKISGYHIYRKTGANSWTPQPCETGVPPSSGFQLVGNAGPQDSVFTDSNIWPIPNGSLGHYIVTAVFPGCAESIADTVVSKPLIVGISEQERLERISVSPNPFQQVVVIGTGDFAVSQLTYKLFSSEGKLLMEGSLSPSENQTELKTDHLPAGVYLLKIKGTDAVITRKLIKVSL